MSRARSSFAIPAGLQCGIALAALVTACTNPSATTGSASPAQAASIPEPTEPAVVPTPTSQPPGSASAVAGATASGSSAPPALAEDEAPLPAVKVVNIGMHIGGGPNDNDTKAPIRASVQPHFDEFRKCWRRVGDPTKAGDFGIDLLIERDGGKAAVSHPRTALDGEGFTECMVKAFEAIDFQKPRKGRTTVSYSLRFTPER